MKEKNTAREWESSPTRDELEAFARQGVRRPRVPGLEERFESRLPRRGARSTVTHLLTRPPLPRSLS